MRQYQQEDIRRYDQPELGVTGQAFEQNYLVSDFMAKGGKHGVIFIGGRQE